MIQPVKVVVVVGRVCLGLGNTAVCPQSRHTESPLPPPRWGRPKPSHFPPDEARPPHLAGRAPPTPRKDPLASSSHCRLLPAVLLLAGTRILRKASPHSPAQVGVQAPDGITWHLELSGTVSAVCSFLCALSALPLLEFRLRESRTFVCPVHSRIPSSGPAWLARPTSVSRGLTGRASCPPALTLRPRAALPGSGQEHGCLVPRAHHLSTLLHLSWLHPYL